ncbi:outer membrane lipoprotein carrier protein LolA [Haloarchaeobius amylolyticus]|uniref:Outer membrane lipoprotein carrier protein LolA n=1 Tax=Haloarchaeobius amylolyticus TaxID=1198296 RepID=A0ABD6BHJ9_9EURY
MNRRRLLAAGVTAALAGCVSYPGRDEPPSSEEVISDAIETRRHMTDLQARRIMTVETPDETVERTERIARKPPAKQRIDVLESTDPDVPSGAVTVTNRATTWEYNPSEEVVDKQYHPNKVDADRTRLVLEGLLEESRLGYEGVETVDGREAHVVETKPPVEDIGPTIELVVGETTFVVPLRTTGDPDAMDVSRIVWIDDEYRYPIKERNTVTIDGEARHRLTVTYEDLLIDEGLEPGTFTYDPPTDATVVTEGRKPKGVFETRAAATELTPYDLPQPTVPASYTLDRVTVVEKAERFGTTTTLWYNDPTVVARELYVAVREVQRFNPDVLETIEIDGHTAYRRDGRIQSVFWSCDDLHYEVSSLTDDTPLLEIASSISCP